MSKRLSGRQWELGDNDDKTKVFCCFENRIIAELCIIDKVNLTCRNSLLPT